MKLRTERKLLHNVLGLVVSLAEIWLGLRFSYVRRFLDKPSGKAERVLAHRTGMIVLT